MARRRSTRKSARKRSARPASAWPGLPKLEQHHLDLIGLGMVAGAAFLAFVLYMGEAGGEAGDGAKDGLRFLLGGAAYLVPPALLAAGAILVLRPLLPTVKPFRAGAICLLLGLTLGLAAGSLGLGPGQADHSPLLDTDYVSDRGGALGELELWAARTLFSMVGAHIIFVFLMAGGILLVTGASIAGVVSATRERVSTTTERLRRAGGPVTAALHHRTGATARLAPTRAEANHPPEPPGEEPVVHATHVEAPALDAAERYPDLFGDGEPGGETPDHDGETTGEWEAAQPPDEGPIEEEPGVTAEPEEPGLPAPQSLTPLGNKRTGVTEADEVEYTLPRPNALKRSNGKPKVKSGADERVGAQLVEALGHFGVEATVVGGVSGPHVTRYEVRLAPGIKMSKVANMRDDLAYALAAEDVRILAPIPGKRAVGVEVPNKIRHMVHLGDVAQAAPEGWSPLTAWLGKDIDGRAIGIDLASQPHVLVAGTTGSGKSGCVNAVLASILMRASPNEVRLVLVDPKQVELNLYEKIPHLITPVVTSPRLAANVLQNLIKEMEERYTLMSAARTRKLEELNRVRVREGEQPLPYLLCVIDELADLMMIAPGEVEDAIIRLAQKSRAVGIHLLLATQRPSADIITGMIKANVPARIAFAVSSQTDSRVILDQNGAESLLGKGDMLFRPGSGTKLSRIQGAFVTEEEIEKITAHWRRQGEPELREEMLEAVEAEEEEAGDDADFHPDKDDLLAEAIRTVVQMDTASTSMLQRRLRVGYTRAGRLIDMLERRGVISGYEGSKARKVLVTEVELPRVLAALEESVAGAAAGPPE
ncbi:MAG: DNA translocase FtsK [Actinomycetota bacterium]|nr:DNA translocase FtsK [Actinomycetota bacterium]